MEIKTDEIASLLRKQLQDLNVDIDISEVGEISMVGDGVARVNGLKNVMSSELVELPNGVYGMALNLEEDNVGLVLFGDSSLVKEGDLAKRTGKVVEVPVGRFALARGCPWWGLAVIELSGAQGFVATILKKLFEGFHLPQPLKAPPLGSVSPEHILRS